MRSASRPRGDALRIVVLGYVVRFPLGGMAWHYLQYVMGLSRLGHDVYFVEDSDDYPSCYDPVRSTVDTDPSYGLGFTGRVFDRVGLGGRWAYYDAHTSRWLGPAAHGITDFCSTADLVVNVSGANPLRPWTRGAPVRVFIDTDPAFEQIRQLTVPKRRARVAQHTDLFSFGENIGREGCSVPDDGLDWRPTRQPVVLDAWPVTPGRPDGKFTTVMQWDSYPPRVHGNRRFGLKSNSFEPFLDLPRRVGPMFELALGTPGAPRALLAGHGWALRDPREPTRDPWTYQRYIQGSKAEFGVAKHGYVVSRSGWFSERSAAYLASGRPVVVQDTGFTDWLDAGSGVVPFSTPEEAAAGVRDVDARYTVHCRAARQVAEEYFDARRVLSDLLDRVGRRPAVSRAGQGVPRSP